MKIVVEFDSLEEFFQNVKTPVLPVTPVQQIPEQPKRMSFDDAMAKAKAAAEDPAEAVGTKFGAVDAETVAETAESAAEPADDLPFKEEPKYALTDVQKAVREVVKAKGKEAAKFVLEKFQHKDKGGPATGASSLKEEDYAAAIKNLMEVLNA